METSGLIRNVYSEYFRREVGNTFGKELRRLRFKLKQNFEGLFLKKTFKPHCLIVSTSWKWRKNYCAEKRNDSWTILLLPLKAVIFFAFLWLDCFVAIVNNKKLVKTNDKVRQRANVDHKHIFLNIVKFLLLTQIAEN